MSGLVVYMLRWNPEGEIRSVVGKGLDTVRARLVVVCAHYQQYDFKMEITIRSLLKSQKNPKNF